LSHLGATSRAAHAPPPATDRLPLHAPAGRPEVATRDDVIDTTRDLAESPRSYVTHRRDAVAVIGSRAVLLSRNNEGLSKYIENVIYDGEIMLYIVCREYAEYELQRQ